MPKVNNYSPKNIRPQRFSPAAPTGSPTKASCQNRKPRPCGCRNMSPLRRNDPPEQPCGKPFTSRRLPSAVPMRQFPPARTGGLTAHCGRRTSSTGLAGSGIPSIPAAEYGSKERHSRRHEIPSRRSVKPFRHTGRFVSGLPPFREPASVAGPLDENGAPHAASSECGENRLVAFFSPDSQARIQSGTVAAVALPNGAMSIMYFSFGRPIRRAVASTIRRSV